MTVARSEASLGVKLPVIWTAPLNDEVWNAGCGVDEPVEDDRDLVTGRVAAGRTSSTRRRAR